MFIIVFFLERRSIHIYHDPFRVNKHCIKGKLLTLLGLFILLFNGYEAAQAISGHLFGASKNIKICKTKKFFDCKEQLISYDSVNFLQD